MEGCETRRLIGTGAIGRNEAGPSGIDESSHCLTLQDGDPTEGRVYKVRQQIEVRNGETRMVGSNGWEEGVGSGRKRRDIPYL